MNDEQIEDLLSQSIHHAPDAIWEKVKSDIAHKIASDLIATLDSLKEPRKQENLDRVESIILSWFPKQLLKGA
jgi:hypothetical protein